LKNNMVFKFNDLEKADLIPGAIYEGGTNKNAGDDPIAKLMNVGNAGGIRTRKSKDGEIAYIVIISNKGNKDKYPNDFDSKTSILTYYGDQFKENREALDTRPKGNKNLLSLFELVNKYSFTYDKPYPVFYFEKVEGKGRNHIFKGIAYPFVKDKDFKEVCFEINYNRISNYVFKFTINNAENISRDWIEDLKISNLSVENSPDTWKDFLFRSRDMKTVSNIPLIEQEKQLDDQIKTAEYIRETKVRKGQNEIRKVLLSKHGCCQLCGLNYSFFLIASHIVPWSEKDLETISSYGNKDYRGDIDNVLLLCVTHDKLFDKYKISFDETGKIMISNEIDTEDFYKLNIKQEFNIEIKEEQEKYLVRHRNKFKAENQ